MVGSLLDLFRLIVDCRLVHVRLASVLVFFLLGWPILLTVVKLRSLALVPILGWIVSWGSLKLSSQGLVLIPDLDELVLRLSHSEMKVLTHSLQLA